MATRLNFTHLMGDELLLIFITLLFTLIVLLSLCLDPLLLNINIFFLVAKRFEKEFGVVRLSIGEAIRRVMSTHAHTKLVKQIEEYLLNGFSLPDELAVETLRLFLMEPVCHNKG